MICQTWFLHKNIYLWHNKHFFPDMEVKQRVEAFLDQEKALSGLTVSSAQGQRYHLTNALMEAGLNMTVTTLKMLESDVFKSLQRKEQLQLISEQQKYQHHNIRHQPCLQLKRMVILIPWLMMPIIFLFKSSVSIIFLVKSSMFIIFLVKSSTSIIS